MIQAHILYSGTVQGVGFRYTVQRYALNLKLKGIVKNLADGNVEIYVEGTEGKIIQLCAHIDKRYAGYVRDKKVIFKPPEKKFKHFTIVI